MKDYFGKSITYTYTDAGQLSTIDAYGVRDWDYNYNALGQLVQYFHPNGLNTYYQFDERNRLTKIHHLDGFTAKARWTYDLDDMGNITKTTNLDDSYWDYEYDLRYRLTKAERYNSSDTLLNSYEYTYDTAGNRLSKVLDGTTTYVYEYDTANELTKQSVGGTDTTFAYDAWGRMTSKDDGTYTATYAYKYADKLASISTDFPGESIISYDYGGDGKRREYTTGGNTNTWYWDAGWNVINYESYSGSKFTYVRDPAGKQLAKWNGTNPTGGGTIWRYYHHDIIRSARMGTRDDKSIVKSYEYTPYGEIYSESGWAHTAWKFTSASGPADELYYFPFRYYSPSLGRWMTRDPVLTGGNRYTYVSNRPVVLVDRYGLWQITIGGAFGIGGYITFGNEGGDWNAGFGVGIGIGAVLTVEDTPDNDDGGPNPFSASLGLEAFGELGIGFLSAGGGISQGFTVDTAGQFDWGGNLNGSAGAFGASIGSGLEWGLLYDEQMSYIDPYFCPTTPTISGSAGGMAFVGVGFGFSW